MGQGADGSEKSAKFQSGPLLCGRPLIRLGEGLPGHCSVMLHSWPLALPLGTIH